MTKTVLPYDPSVPSQEAAKVWLKAIRSYSGLTNDQLVAKAPVYHGKQVTTDLLSSMDNNTHEVTSGSLQFYYALLNAIGISETQAGHEVKLLFGFVARRPAEMYRI